MALLQLDLSEGALLSIEEFWRDRYEWLQRVGYSLRPRYKPGWVPSWRGTDKSHRLCEDGIMLMVSSIRTDCFPSAELSILSSRPV